MEKALNKLTSLSDMGRFPWTVHLGASCNIVFTLWVTHVVFTFTAGTLIYLLPYASGMIALNLAPVILLSYLEKADRPYPAVENMSFFSDQHRFSTWVYAVASGNMFFWITLAWCIFSYSPASATLVLLQLIAFLATYVPFLRFGYQLLKKA